MPRVLSLFTGGGGLDLGFEQAGFRDHLACVEIDEDCVSNLRLNRPAWNSAACDVRGFDAAGWPRPDVLLAGIPCQGFSLGGHRRGSDGRNQLYREVARVAAECRPRVVVVENVLNLRNMRDADGTPFAELIRRSLEAAGYGVAERVYRMSDFGVPQTRRRFVFLAADGEVPRTPDPPEGADPSPRRRLEDICRSGLPFPNHDPAWGSFGSRVHRETLEEFDPDAVPTPVRLSRTASDGNPVRSLDRPFPAIDTGTVWGWAAGPVSAERVDCGGRVPLWRITASALRSFTVRELARLQTFPDDWEFRRGTGTSLRRQVGNAVPPEFARFLGLAVAGMIGGCEDDAA